MKKRICMMLLGAAVTLCACGTEATYEEPTKDQTEEAKEDIADVSKVAEEEIEVTEVDIEAEGDTEVEDAGDLLGGLLGDAAEYLDAIEGMDIDTIVAKYISNDHCWIACLEKEAYVLYFDGLSVSITHLENEDGEISVSVINGDYTLGEDLLSIAGDEELHFNWELVQEGELISLILIDQDGNEMILYQPEVETEDDAVELAIQYLENELDMDEIEDEDISTLLAGYEGVSIVDAFIQAGLNPAFSNRAIFAEKLEIENYKGTAEQNLFMIEAMGGVVK